MVLTGDPPIIPNWDLDRHGPKEGQYDLRRWRGDTWLGRYSSPGIRSTLKIVKWIQHGPEAWEANISFSRWSKNFLPVFRIYDILVRIRIWILESIYLIYGSGSCSVTSEVPTKNKFVLQIWFFLLVDGRTRMRSGMWSRIRIRTNNYGSGSGRPKNAPEHCFWLCTKEYVKCK